MTHKSVGQDTMHTPGPWIWADDNNGLIGAGGEDVLSYADYEGMWLTFNDHQEANARLIALAPEMAEALRMVLQHGRIDDSESRMNQVAAIIAKIDGAK